MFHGKVEIPLAVSKKGLSLIDLIEILKHASNPKLHDESWEVVTNTCDEKLVCATDMGKKRHNKQTQPPLSTVLPAAIRASSNTGDLPSIETLQHGAQAGDPNLCEHQSGCAVGISRGQHTVHAPFSQRGGHCEAARSDDTTRVGRTNVDRGKTCRQELFSSPGHRCELRGVHEEDRLHPTVGPELSQLIM